MPPSRRNTNRVYTLRQARIRALDDPAAAARELGAMAREEAEEEHMATVFYFLFKITSDPEHRARAVELYQKVLGTQFEIEYRQRLDELMAAGPAE